MIDRSTYSTFSWLIHCSSGDVNWKNALKRATVEELREALTVLEGQTDTKTACKQIAARIRRLEREAKG